MARFRPANRFDRLVAAAADAFIANGYHRTQVQDVADPPGVAKGTVYGYVASKEALFGAALRYADGAEPPPAPGELPIPASGVSELAALVTDRLAGEVAQLRLTQALAGSPGPVGEQLPAIITYLYARLSRHRVAFKLVDRCAPELPELAEVWFGQGRHAQVTALAAYLTGHRRRRPAAPARPGRDRRPHHPGDLRAVGRAPELGSSSRGLPAARRARKPARGRARRACRSRHPGRATDQRPARPARACLKRPAQTRKAPPPCQVTRATTESAGSGTGTLPATTGRCGSGNV